ncbi:MAG: L-threonylcarbamoyladenylate synthase [Tenuifilum sp.]|uniref:L-threonylcarbamoyladenylate synthase n=1 Tax=Tenuifilum sp. TaxID=2760880 RepID=UPI001B5289E6|nr:threonylcarbamoyl-AMP synthase [Bacteroidales bacterium]HON70139.1 L-threonylcarbamoyladenylate synthase [Tenuifilum sp.]MBP9028910.1 threonylcarbamoyl-AMP synthase [Bacteroidales bacterium]HOU73713.1 L-threonylcarbamoyladenylate synthase [Tenuifilum sp.]HQE53582.1 L-threonylcarbamoyladenylate synthase [Tenuifilum sp.]
MGIVGVDIDHAASIIANGGVVAFPTETVYGLGANALNPNAVAKVFALKERPSFDPLIVHIASAESINLLSSSNDPRVFQLAERFWPGPLTIVVPKSTVVPGIVTSDLDTVGIRMPNHPIALELIKKSGCVIAAPSANKFGRVSPTRAEHVLKQLPEVDYILDGGRTTVGIESTVITLDEEGFIILRHGAITHSHLAQVLKPSGAHKPLKGLASPGLLKSHYSPNKPLYIAGETSKPIDPSRAGYIAFGKKPEGNYKRVEYLSETGDMVEAAAHLFEKIHAFEDSDVEYIVADPVPEVGIGIAIMDRLRKAAYRYK